MGGAIAFMQRLLLAAALAILSSSHLTNCSKRDTVSMSTDVVPSSPPSNSLASSSGTATSSTSLPSQSIDPRTSQDIQTIFNRRIADIATGLSNIPAWLSTLDANGTWPASEVDYTSGCTAQRANWPAQTHWTRLVTMASAWHGGLPGSAGNTDVNNTALLDAISRAMDYWFKNDFTVPGCIDSGGNPACPCGTPGLWNTNWFSNVILIPRLVGEVCLLVQTALTPTQLAGCNNILSRTYSQFFRPIIEVSWRTGANVLDTASISIDLGLLTTNVSVVQAGYGFVHEEVVAQNVTSADGIRPDGSFGQHAGVLYNGNYGKDYANDVLALEINAGGTQFSAANNSRAAFDVLIDGDQWMIFQNMLTGVLHWDFSALGRFISFPVADSQATGSININVSSIRALGELWQSNTLTSVADSLNKNTSTANVGDLFGNRMFYNNDYMVHRGPGYVTTVKMFSTRTKNGECLNSQNPLGFHLSDGTVYTYLQGNEYEDIAASWDWNLIPGITTDYGATPLTCNSGVMGVEAFVGGVSDGQVGIAAMHYTNPTTHNITWQKAWFLLEDDVQIVVLSDLSSVSPNVVSVLDQRRRDGAYFVNGLQVDDRYDRAKRHTQGRHHGRAIQIDNNQNISDYDSVSSLWHGGVGYAFNQRSPLSLSVQSGEKTGNWSALGISTQPPTTVDFFTAWINQPASNTFAYTVFPGTTRAGFEAKALLSSLRNQVICNNKTVSAVLDHDKDTAFVIFWGSDGGSVLIPQSNRGRPAITLSADANSAVVYRIGEGNVTVSDPSQNKTSLNLEFAVAESERLGLTEPPPPGFGQDSTTTSLFFQLPVGGLAGSSITQTL